MKKFIFLLVLYPLLTRGQSSFIEGQAGTPALPISLLGAYITPPSKQNVLLSTFGLANENYVRLTASPSMSIINTRSNLIMHIGVGAGVHIIRGSENFRPHIEFLTAGTKFQGCLKPDHDFNWDIRISLGLDNHYWHMLYVNYQLLSWLKLGIYSQTKFFTGPRAEINYKLISVWGGVGINPESPWNPPVGFGVRITPGVYERNRRLPF